MIPNGDKEIAIRRKEYGAANGEIGTWRVKCRNILDVSDSKGGLFVITFHNRWIGGKDMFHVSDIRLVDWTDVDGTVSTDFELLHQTCEMYANMTKTADAISAL